MKKHLLYFSFILVTGTCAYGQRNCGTMENLELRKKQDPALEQRMADEERKINDWIKSHPTENDVIKLPAIPGYLPTGNLAIDRVNYAKAKESYYEKNATANTNGSSSINKKTTRNEKRKVNSFIVK